MKISKDEPALPRCYFSHAIIPKYTDQARPPTKQQPFKAFLQHAPFHTVDFLLPDEIYTILKDKLSEPRFKYARVFMTLLDILTGDFFAQYLKAGNGNILMLSEGIPGIQNTFKLKDGVLTLDIDKATYERCGLVGAVAHDHPGRKHVKSRFKVEIDLKLGSMQHGKKGFERVKWAFKNVLSDSLAWLFVDLEREDDEEAGAGPVAALHPQVQTLEPVARHLRDVVVPFVRDEETLQDQLYEEQLLEWLGLIMLGSPRVEEGDNIDSYLCKYALPEAFEDEYAKAQDITHLSWHGFGSAVFVRHIWMIMRAATKGREDVWFSLSGKAFDGTSFTALCNDGEHVMLWECD